MGRLTTFSKFIITLLIVGAVYFGFKYVMNNTEAGKKLAKDSQEATSSSGTGPTVASRTYDKDPNVIKIGVVTWGGYVGGQYFNEGFEPSEKSRFFKDYGFKVGFKVLDDFDASRAAWKKGDVDLLWTTADAFPTESAALKDFDPVVVFQADWSRGGDAIVVQRNITKVSDLRGKKIAVAELTPSHTFLLWLLEAGGLTGKDVEIVKQPTALDAAQTFKAKTVDAAVVWSPSDEECLAAVPGSRVLESTRSASNIIADVFIAKRSWVNANRDKLQQLYEGWMKGAAEINTNPAAKQKAAQILTDAFSGTPLDANIKSINNVRLCTHGDNLNFFGLNPNYKNVTGEMLYNRMTDVYKRLGYADTKTPSWRFISDPSVIKATNLTGNANAAEGQKTFAAVTSEVANKEAIATKQVSITFRSGEYQLDENAKYIVDREMVDLARGFSNSLIRVQGNTDNIGSEATNKSLSLKRAQSVVDYLVNTYSMSRSRFVVVGNGSAKPVGDNDSDAGKAKNRRTDFEIISE